MPQQLFSIADLLLHDDDATIRSQAAECIGVAFRAGYPICQEVAEKRLWLHAMEHFKDTDRFAEQLLAELVNPHDIGKYFCSSSQKLSLSNMSCRTTTQGP
jgi:hypothetical protein